MTLLSDEGRELDARIALEVMGATETEAGTIIGTDLREDSKDIFATFGERIVVLPHYSTDIADAWRVVERMREVAPPRFQNLQLVAYAYNRTYATFDAEAFDEYDPDTWTEANGEHATPEAICKAALAAVRSQSRAGGR